MKKGIRGAPIGLLFACSTAAVFLGLTILHDDGIVGQTKKPLRAPLFQVKGCFCHGDTASPFTRVWVSGPESLMAGARVLYTISVAKDSSIAAGFDVAAMYGELGVYDSVGTKLMRIDPNNPVDSLELTHTGPRLAMGSDTISWSFWYHAPRGAGVRIDTLYASGNSVDTSYDPAGDHWNFAPNFTIRVVPASDVHDERIAREFSLMQNYPNPFNPSTTIEFAVPASSRSLGEGRMTDDRYLLLRVYDMLGREVATLFEGRVEPGMYRVTWNAAGVSSGVYLYRLSTPGAVQTRKLLVLR